MTMTTSVVLADEATQTRSAIAGFLAGYCERVVVDVDLGQQLSIGILADDHRPAAVQVDADVLSLHGDLPHASCGCCFGQPECANTRPLSTQGDPLLHLRQFRHTGPPLEHPTWPHHDDRSRESGDPLLHDITPLEIGVEST